MALIEPPSDAIGLVTVRPFGSEKSKEIARSSDAGHRIKASPFTWIDPSTIPPRRFIYAKHYVRSFLTATFAPAGVGKTSLGVVESIAIVTGRALLGIYPTERTNVWIWNGEDPADELQRRLAAACIHYRVPPEEVEGHLFVDSGRDTPIIIAEAMKSGVTISRPIADAVIDAIRSNDIGLMIVDPFVSSHHVPENDNSAIEAVVAEWATIADRTNCAIEVVHHVRKTGGAEVTVDDARGASALLAKVRSARALNPMTEEEASRAGVENRRTFFRIGGGNAIGKANLMIASDKAEWFQIASIDLGNALGFHPSDSVGVVTNWKWPDPLESVTVDDLRSVQRLVAEGRWRENVQANDWIGKPIATALKLNPANKADVRKISSLLKIWIDTGMFVRVVGKDAKRMEKTFVEVGTWAND